MRDWLSDSPAFKSLLFGTTVFTCLASLAGFAGRLWWTLDLTSHFRLQYVVVLLFSVLALACIRLYWLAVVPALFALLNLMILLPWLWVSSTPPRLLQGTARAMLINVNTSNTNHALVLSSIRSHAPDFVFLEEVDPRWMAGLKPLDSDYPHSFSHPRMDNFGVAFYSRYPLLKSSILDVGDAGNPSLLVGCELAGRAFYILGVHTLPPVNAAYVRFRDTQLARIPGVLKTLDAPVLLLGDLNATPWSYPFRRLMRESGLRDASRGLGYRPTWPDGMLLMQIPIDHCLHSPELLVMRREIGSTVGSDHFPVIVDFSWNDEQRRTSR